MELELSKIQVMALDHYKEGCDCKDGYSFNCGYCRDVKRRLYGKEVEVLNQKGLMNGYQISPKGWRELQQRRAK